VGCISKLSTILVCTLTLFVLDRLVVSNILVCTLTFFVFNGEIIYEALLGQVATLSLHLVIGSIYSGCSLTHSFIILAVQEPDVASESVLIFKRLSVWIPAFCVLTFNTLSV
jgi:hypothetical protein